jgi:hypothetical protein
MAGLALPFLTEADPEQAGEGSLDPLRLLPTAESLAEEVLPNVTNRMSRLRFLTAIAVGSSATAGLEDLPPKDGVTTPYLAFEWHVVEAMARRLNGAPRDARLGIPGITKAQAVIRRGSHLSHATYLKTPKVFGFFGIYKRLAIGVDLVDPDLVLQGAGDELLRAWEHENGLEGFADSKNSSGGRMAQDIRRAVKDALLAGAVTRPPSSWLWTRLSSSLRLDQAGKAERRLLRRRLLDAEQPMRRELISLVSAMPPAADADILRAVRRDASPALKRRLLAIDAYERMALLLSTAFDVARRLSTANGLRPVSTSEVAKSPLVTRIAAELAPAFARACSRIDRVGGGRVLRFETDFGRFEAPLKPVAFVDELMEHHKSVQAEKQARPWLEEDERGFFVRSPYTLHEEPVLRDGYLHPYRVLAVQSFLADLR